MSAEENSLPASRKKDSSRWALRVIVGAAVLGLAGMGLLLSLSPTLGQTALPELGRAPPFQLITQSGQPFDSKQLDGKLWVANFVFTRCPTICPRFTQKMAELERNTRQVGASLHFISLTVDPEHDTPETLARYAQEYDANLTRWTFLTGSREALEGLIIKGLHVHMGKGAEGADDIMSIGHGGHFVLVDQKGTIRGYYDSADAAAIPRLTGDISRLAAAGR